MHGRVMLSLKFILANAVSGAYQTLQAFENVVARDGIGTPAAVDRM
jgi:hypothetical protein